LSDKLAHRPEINGLRAFAVIPVIFFHAGFQTFSGGFVGVDVFFVISGYLITSIIMKDIEARRFSFVDFYERRARRILPALFAMLALCVPFAWAWLFPEEFKAFANSVVAVCLFFSNILFWRQENYFDAGSDLNPLLHTWSLAVEEQFYIVHPIILLFLVRFARKRLKLVLAATAVASLCLSHYLSAAYPSFNFYWLPTRAWELLAGSLCAVTPLKNRRGFNMLGLAGLGLLLVSVFGFSERTPMPSFYGLVPVLGTCLIILCARQGTYAARILSLRPIVLIGLISYSAYLFHQPILAFARIGSLGPLSLSVKLMLIVVTLVAAYLSWRFVETPWRARTGALAISRRAVAISAVTAAVAFTVFGIGGRVTQGYAGVPFRLSVDEKLQAAIGFPSTFNGWCFVVDYAVQLPIGTSGTNCKVTAAKGAAKNALLFGDSFAGQYEPFWKIVGEQAGIDVKSVTTSWCYPALTSGFSGPATSLAYQQCLYNRKFLAGHAADFDVIILAGSWHAVLLQDKLKEVQDVIKTLSEKTPLVIIMASPTQFDQDIGRKYLFAQARNRSFSIKDFTKEQDLLADKANTILEAYASSFKNVIFLNRLAMFNENGYPSDVSETGAPYSWEGKHISILGAEQAARNFLRTRTYDEIRRRLSDGSDGRMESALRPSADARRFEQ
jgi:peptidoglycan/LPS O-acetylase OafA/YrhL